MDKTDHTTMLAGMCLGNNDDRILSLFFLISVFKLKFLSCNTSINSDFRVQALVAQEVLCSGRWGVPFCVVSRMQECETPDHTSRMMEHTSE